MLDIHTAQLNKKRKCHVGHIAKPNKKRECHFGHSDQPTCNKKR